LEKDWGLDSFGRIFGEGLDWKVWGEGITEGIGLEVYFPGSLIYRNLGF